MTKFLRYGRVGMGLWFAWLGGMKLFASGPVEFSRQVAGFQVLMDPWNLLVAYLIPWTELVCGVLLAVQAWPRAAARNLILLSLVFLFGNLQALWRGLDPDCGCFGPAFALGLHGRLWVIGAQIIGLAALVAVESRVRRTVFRGQRMRLGSGLPPK